MPLNQQIGNMKIVEHSKVDARMLMLCHCGTEFKTEQPVPTNVEGLPQVENGKYRDIKDDLVLCPGCGCSWNAPGVKNDDELELPDWKFYEIHVTVDGEEAKVFIAAAMGYSHLATIAMPRLSHLEVQQVRFVNIGKEAYLEARRAAERASVTNILGFLFG